MSWIDNALTRVGLKRVPRRPPPVLPLPTAGAPLRKLKHGDVVMRHEIIELYSEHPIEDGSGFAQLFDLVQGRTGVRFVANGSKGDGPIKVCDGD